MNTFRFNLRATSSLLMLSLFLFAGCEEEQLPPVKPELISPTANADNQEYNITFSWKASDNADSYTFQLSLSNDFSSSELYKESISNTSLDVTDLKHSVSYFWRVNAVNGSGASAWSSTGEFSTKALNVPSTIAPVANSVISPNNVTFEWVSISEATGYNLQVSTKADFTELLINRVNQSGTNFIQPELLHSTNYYWRISSVKNGISSSWSASTMFTTENLGVPSLISPGNNVTNSLRSIEFKWGAVVDADTYEFQLSTTDDFLHFVATRIDLTQALCTIDNLMFSTNYFWRVRSEKNGKKSEWSSTRKLTTEPLGIPQLQSPIDNAHLASNSIEFKWGAVNEATSYNLQVSNSADFSTIALNKSGLTTLSFTSALPPSNSTYYWRVNAQVDNCQSEWSTVRSFLVPSIPTAGLVAWYPFNGNANDESGNNNNGTLVGGVTATTDRKGQSNKAFFFDGSSGYIQIPTLNNFQYKPVSYSAWVIVNSYFPLSPGHKFRSIIGRQEFSNTVCGMLGFWADQNVVGGLYDNTFSYWMGGAAQPDVSYSKTKPSLNNWVHLVFTQDINGNFKFYMDGVLTNSGNLNNTQSANISFRIGAGIGANSYFWNNKIDDVRIYNRVLSQIEVLGLLNE